MQRCVEWQSFEYINKRKNKEGKWKKCVKSVKRSKSRPTKESAARARLWTARTNESFFSANGVLFLNVSEYACVLFALKEVLKHEQGVQM
jgi:hypothetical protein